MCPELFVTALLHQNEGFDILRTQEFKVNKKRRKSEANGKDGQCDKKMSHTSYQLPVMLPIFSFPWLVL